jgi:hypothetical protein
VDENLKLLYGIALKMLYSEGVLAKLSQGLEASQKPVDIAGKMLAMIMQRAIANAQKSGATLKNDTVMKALAMLVKETVNILGGKGTLQKDKAGDLAKVLLASTLKGLKDLSVQGPNQGGGVQPASAGVQQQPQPVQQQGVQTQQAQPQGLINSQMQGAA